LQLERRSKPVAVTIVFREGPIPPDRQWLGDLLEILSPDSLQNGANINAYPAHPWPPNIERIAMFSAVKLSEDDRFGRLRLDDAVGAEVRSPDGLRAYVLKLYR
jgi:hypothetical protein